MRPLILALSCALAAAPLTAPAASGIVLPDFGDVAQRYLEPAREQRIGAAVYRQLLQRDLVVTDAELTGYLNRVGQRLAAASDGATTFTFFLVRNGSINAFAAPGGYIGVHHGLLLATQTEAELAGVLAHEISHVTQRHIARGIAAEQGMSLPLIAAMVASALVSAANPEVGQAAIAGTMAASAQRRINFTRTHEQEADRLGVQLLRSAGYDPEAMADFFARLERHGGGIAGQLPEFLLTHPRPTSRVGDTRGRAADTRAAPAAAGSELPYLLAKARARALLEADTASLLREAEARIGASQGLQAHAEAYARALLLVRAARVEEAATALRVLRSQGPDGLALRLAEADLALARGDRAAAWGAFEEAWALYPGDAVLAERYASALATQGDPRRALSLLQPLLRRHITAAPFYALAAQAAQRLGDPALTHAHMAEHYYLNDDLDQAVAQAELGLRKAARATPQQALLQTRLRELQEIRERRQRED